MIFIDGLDQLHADANGEPDLSFLPNNLPVGIVIVLSTRSNDILRPLELYRTHCRYELPNLSRADFNLILKRQGVNIDNVIGNQLYQLMQQNALYLDLVAKELSKAEISKPEEIIKRVTDNPGNIFSLSIGRLKKPSIDWREVLKPILGILLVAREPLAARHLRQILGVEDDRLRDGLARLSGLVTDDGRQRYSLFHLKFYDYLRQDESNPHKDYIFATDEEQAWHHILANWCEKDNISIIWSNIKYNLIEQSRREYARQYYITHLYGASEWTQIFAVLNERKYGQAKLYNDRSIHSYIQDLELGRQAAAGQEWTKEEAIALLPMLWRYTLLQRVLTNQVNCYPQSALKTLVLLRRHREAINLVINATTKLYEKAGHLLYLADLLSQQSDLEQECLPVLLKVHDLAKTYTSKSEKVFALERLGRLCAKIQQWELAEIVLQEATILALGLDASDNCSTWTLRDLVESLAQVQQWNRAEAVGHSINSEWDRALALNILGCKLAGAHQWDWAIALWTEAENTAHALGEKSIWVLNELASELARAQQWDRALAMWVEVEKSARALKEVQSRIAALCQLARNLAQARQWDHAQELLKEPEIVNYEITEFSDEAWVELGRQFAGAQQWEQAEMAISKIKRSNFKKRVMRDLAPELARAQQWDQALDTARKLEPISFDEGGGDMYLGPKLRVLCQVGGELTKTQQWKRAEEVWEEAVSVANSIPFEERAHAMCELSLGFALAQQWERAILSLNEFHKFQEKAVESMNISFFLKEMAYGLIKTQQWECAGAVTSFIASSTDKIEILSELASSLAAIHQWERAEAVWDEAKAIIPNVFNHHGKARALCKMAQSFAKMQRWGHAQAAWEEVEAVLFTSERQFTADTQTLGESQALFELVDGLAELQQWDHAEAICRAMKYPAKQTVALSRVACWLAKAQQWNRAEARWAEIEIRISTLNSSEENYEKIEALRELASSLTEAQQWDRAEVVISSIESLLEKAEALGELASELATAQQLERAKPKWEEARMIIHTVLSEVTSELTEPHLRKQDQWEEDRKSIQTVSTPFSHKCANILSEIASELTKAHLWEQGQLVWDEVEVLISSIDSSYEINWGDVASAFVRGLVEMQQWDRAEVFACALKNHDCRSAALNELVYQFSKTRQWDRVASLISTAKDSLLLCTVEVLQNLLIGLYGAGKIEYPLRAIQSRLLQATTKDLNYELFQLCVGFVPLKPEISIAFCEAFTWVDTFFQVSFNP